MGKTFGVNVVVGIPSFGMVSTYFLQSRLSQQFPLVSSAIDKIVLNKPIADARNEIVEFALSQGANYIYWLDDDVIAPPDSFLRLYSHRKDIVNGVYWSKSNPPMPLVFRNHLEGPYWDWHVGDLIEIDAAGNGLTLVRTDVYKKIQDELGGPWYSTDYSSFQGVTETPSNNTEDLYFYWKARQVGYEVWCDTRVQALHYDKTNQVLYGMPPDAPQARAAWEIVPQGEKLIADIGSGPVSPYFAEGKSVSFDIREDMRPDVVCDIRNLPVPSETFDIVFSSHTLEHFSWLSIDKVLKEWTRVLKVGGELRVIVPNLRHVAKRLLADTLIPTDIWVLYGEQDYAKNFHAVGFTPNVLRRLVETMKVYENIEIIEGNIDGPPGGDSWNLMVTATKTKNMVLDNITPDYIEKPPINQVQWPFRIYEKYNERPMTTEEVINDKLKWIGPETQELIAEEIPVEKPKRKRKVVT